MSHPHKRRRKPLPSAEAIAGNDDLMTQILIRFPAKSLCRFKSVSKRWYSLISHPDFSFLRMPHSTSGLFFSISSRTHSLYKYVHLAGTRIRSPPPFKPPGIDIKHSCNGLSLLSSSDDHWVNSNYYIYNPTTKQFAIIPTPCDDSTTEQSMPAINLAFDPSRALHYRIVLVRSVSSPGSSPFDGTWTHPIEIYSSETGAWRISGDPFTSTNLLDFTNGIFFNGKMHWVSSQWKTWLCFDFDKECLETMPMPRSQDGKDVLSVSNFGESGGHLYVIGRYVFSAAFEVLEMESDYSTWFLKYRIDLDDVAARFVECPSFTECSILHLVLGEVEEESFFVLRIPGMILSYNLKDKKVKKLCNFVRCGVWPPAHQYIENLFRI